MALPIPKRCRQFVDDDEFSSLKKKKKVEVEIEIEVDWGSVRAEILTEIAKRLPTLESFECFGSVCRSWKAAAADCSTSEFPHRKTTLEGPWLLLPGEAEKDEEDKDCFVISRRILLGGRTTRKIVELPPGVTKNHDHKQYFISCKDWLLVVSGEDGDDASLVHPLSRVQIHLPSLATLRGQMIDARGRCRHLSHPRHRPDSRRHKIIHKFVLSADPFSTPNHDFLVMVTWGQYYSLGFCKPRDPSWKLIKPQSDWYDDNLFHELMYNRHDNKLYALNLIQKLAVCDIHGPNPTELHFLHDLTSPRISSDPLVGTKRNKRYLLEWKKKNTFLVVYHHLETKRDAPLEEQIEARYVTTGFVVEEVNMEDGSRSEVKQLGNKSLFVGGNSSFHVDCSEKVNKNIKPNCIYFAGDNFFMFPTIPEKYFKGRGSKEVGVYNLADRSFQYLLSYDDDNGVVAGTTKTPPPIWFGPSF